MPAVASGGSTVPSTLCKISKARGSGLVIWTGMGLVGFLSSRLGRWSGTWGRRRGRLVELILDALERAGGLLERRRRRRRFAQGRDLLGEHVLIARQIAGKLRGLLRHHPAKAEDDGEGKSDHDDHGKDARHLDLAQEQKQRRQHEAQQNGKRKRKQDLARRYRACR